MRYPDEHAQGRVAGGAAGGEACDCGGRAGGVVVVVVGREATGLIQGSVSSSHSVCLLDGIS